MRISAAQLVAMVRPSPGQGRLLHTAPESKVDNVRVGRGRVFSKHQRGCWDDTYLWNDENSFGELFEMALQDLALHKLPRAAAAPLV